MVDAARELRDWVGEHRWVLFLATVAAFCQLHYDEHGPPSHVLILPSLAVLVFLAIPAAAAVFHDARDTTSRILAAAAGLVALVPALLWGHGQVLLDEGQRIRRVVAEDPVPLVAVTALAILGVALAAWRAGWRPGDWGLSFGDVKWWRGPVGLLLLLIAVGIPTVAWFFPEFVKFYPRYGPTKVRPDVWALVQYQLAMGVYMFCWEFFFRGFMLFGLARWTGPLAANLLQASPFFLLHDAKPEPEFISSWFGGLLMGWLCLRARSFWPAFLLHWAQYATMEVSAFTIRHYL